MPWQQHVADVAYEIDPETGRLAYSELVLTVPRQSGKTTLVLAKIVHRCVGFGEPQVVTYTAQTRNAARKKWEDEHLVIIEKAKSFKNMFKVRRVNGSEAILWRNGSRYQIEAVKATSGHGDVLDEGIIDEAFAHQTNAVEQAMNPGMITRPWRQLVVISTAGDQNSAYLYRKVLNGRTLIESGQQSSVAYFEWSAPEDAPIDDEDVWWECMPALGHTISIQAIRTELSRARAAGEEGESLFRRGYLNQWVNPPILDGKVASIIDLEQWKRLVDVDSSALDPVVLGIDASPDLRSAAIGAAGWRAGDQRIHAETIAHRADADWLPEVLAAVCRINKPQAVVVDPRSPIGGLLPDIRRALGEGRRALAELVEVDSSELARATQLFVTSVKDGRLRHLGTPEMTVALEGARKRPMGESWAWSRKDASTDVSPLVACTLAVWSLAGAPPPKPKPVFGPSTNVVNGNEVFRPTQRLRL